MPFRGQARRDRGPRRRRAGRDPVRQGVLRDRGRGVLRAHPDRDARRRPRGSVGENFRFGRKARGDAEMLAERDEFETRVVPLVEVTGRRFPRRRIRALIEVGDLEDGHALPRRAVPVRGRGRRRATSVAASSASRPRTSCPTTTRAPWPRRLRGLRERRCRRRPRRRAPDVRDRPRAPGRAPPDRLEGDLYGQILRVAFIARLRGEKRFPSVEDLIAAMHRDVADARELCAAYKPPRRAGDRSLTCRPA